MKTHPIVNILSVALICAISLTVTLVFDACTKQSIGPESAAIQRVATAPRPVSTTSVFLQAEQVVALCHQAGVAKVPVFDSLVFAQVSGAWLAGFKDRFQARLFSDGLSISVPGGQTGWDTSFDCIYLADAFHYLANLEYHSDARRIFSTPPGLAMVRVFYHPDGAKANHVIFLVLTDHGGVFYDPQVGPVKLSPTELASIVRTEA